MVVIHVVFLVLSLWVGCRSQDDDALRNISPGRDRRTFAVVLAEQRGWEK